MRRAFTVASAAILLLLAACNPVVAVETRQAPRAAIASAHPLATEAGMQILAAGGNAFDAAVTVAAVLGVVEPYSAGIGGGGFWLLRFGDSGEYRFVDARETAPGEASADMYLDAGGVPEPRASLDGPLAAGIPGQAAAFVHLAGQYGKLKLSTLMQPAVRAARKGFAADEHYRRLALYRLLALQDHDEAAGIFLPDGIPEPDSLIVQKDLGDTLELLGEHGFDGFYRGPVAEKLVSGVRAAGGIWSLQDLAEYRVIEREPIRFKAGDYQFVSAPPPSAGGIALATILNILEHWPWQTLGPIDQTHLLVEAMRRAYRDRAEYLGDPDFHPVPVKRLISREHARLLNRSIRMETSTPSLELPAAVAAPGSGTHTTHLSVMDRHGNMVAATLSINTPFGSAFVAPGTGVLLNNEMDDFAAAPGRPNTYGLVGSKANAIVPGKRPLSSMTPTIIESPHGFAILGTPGGSRIITMVLLGALEHMQAQDPVAWVSRPRFHHQYLPDAIQHEPNTFNATLRAGLLARGHQLKSVGREYGNMQAIFWNRRLGTVTAASDPRGIGAAMVR